MSCSFLWVMSDHSCEVCVRFPLVFDEDLVEAFSAHKGLLEKGHLLQIW